MLCALAGIPAALAIVPAAEQVARHFLQAGAGAEVEGFSSPRLRDQMTELAGQETTPSAAAAVLAELAALVGFLTLEIGGHFVGTADPADHLWGAVVARQGDH